MHHTRPSIRLLMLGLSLLSGCAASRFTADASSSDPASAPYSAYLIGRFAQDNDQLMLASHNLLVALAHDPANPVLLEQTFVACMLDGRPEAVTLARQLPDNPIAVLLLGDTAARAGNWAAAQKSYASLSHPGVGELTPLLVAWAQQGGADVDGALATLQPRFSGQPLSALYLLHAAMIADLGNRFPQAQHLYSGAAGGFNDINLRIARILANWQFRQGHVDDATATLQSLGTASPALAIVVPRLVADLRTRPVRSATDGLAEVYLSFAAQLPAQPGNETQTALLRLALDMRPDLTAARMLMADQLDADKHADSALRVLAPVANQDPLAPLVRLRRAQLENEAGNTAAAMAGLRSLATDMPGSPEPLALIAELQRGHNQPAAAAATYTRALALAPPGSGSAWPLLFGRAVSEQQTGDWAASQADLQQALKIAPDQPALLNFLGYSWADRNVNLSQAHAMIAKAAAEAPNDGAIIDSLGWVQLRQGDIASAVRSLERAVQMEPEDPEINGHLGDAYWAAGFKLQARYQWQLALNLKPDPAAVPKLQAKLADAERATR